MSEKRAENCGSPALNALSISQFLAEKVSLSSCSYSTHNVFLAQNCTKSWPLGSVERNSKCLILWSYLDNSMLPIVRKQFEHFSSLIFRHERVISQMRNWKNGQSKSLEHTPKPFGNPCQNLSCGKGWIDNIKWIKTGVSLNVIYESRQVSKSCSRYSTCALKWPWEFFILI